MLVYMLADKHALYKRVEDIPLSHFEHIAFQPAML
ncbi:hypothetical protein J2Z82_003621 [Virgibacillus litoralis]|uniref:Uncharacterized protein n=1 Tax=Virgibacillus litoralis TaxID=578221 RepID=A0ABS4HIB5_9BACI|nr:hypothetical protein [Virgibacillus litoralis]